MLNAFYNRIKHVFFVYVPIYRTQGHKSIRSFTKMRSDLSVRLARLTISLLSLLDRQELALKCRYARKWRLVVLGLLFPGVTQVGATVLKDFTSKFPCFYKTLS